MRRRRWLSLLVLPPVLFLAACGGGSSPPPPPVTVLVTPSLVTLPVNGTQQFTATVSGTTNTAVSWNVNGIAGGNSAVGTISSAGLYTAPSLAPSPATVTIHAVSQADPTKSGSASATVKLSVTVSPPSPVSVNIGGTVQFTATVVGSANTAVNWTVNGVAGGNSTVGTISASGLYTAPAAVPSPNATVTVAAVAQADPTSSGSSSVTIVQGGNAGLNQATQNPPVKLGTSGGNIKDKAALTCCSGTLGALVTRSGTNYILSNNHVLALSGGGTTGDAISQPGLVDTNCAPGQTVANLSQFAPLQKGGVDAALAAIVAGQVDTTGAILQLGTLSSGTPQPAPPASTTVAPAVAMAVAKSGRTTGLTCGAITLINVSVQVGYSTTCGGSTTLNITYNNQVEIDGATFSAAGDSGSVIVNAQTAQPVALLFAGDTTSTIGNPIGAVLQALADPNTGTLPTFVGSAQHTVSACTGFFPVPGGGGPSLAQNTLQALSATEIERATSAKEQHVKQLMSDPAVLGVGVGAGDVPGEAAIVVLVERGKSHRPIPAMLDGVRTRVRSVDPYRAYGWNEKEPTRCGTRKDSVPLFRVP